MQDPNNSTSEEAARTEKYNMEPAQPAKEAATHYQSNTQAHTDKETASPNSAPTSSEEALRGSRHNKSPEQLQKEATANMGN
ncbi:hypothetical protein K437DRAFT_257804 [Tilletiaria anomala UBC 951]|uniref:Uncharacterized protein n=1 Tax=Tilletiaria anomala (strain ATCC 24038 / CBS 436.72 / UBC 951) TaxID=1037660 RepID=A0A066VUX7_TILAU|nr:uncharacterized protein K437DRAFT_257804 [Tilletiaria anomala UBC 951]KDN42619.1 hypothetical protein K437DRAFT_257804 [Tilletiaria anomala UBC 951]